MKLIGSNEVFAVTRQSSVCYTCGFTIDFTVDQCTQVLFTALEHFM